MFNYSIQGSLPTIGQVCLSAPDPKEISANSSQVDTAQDARPEPSTEEVSIWTYIFGKPGELRRDLSFLVAEGPSFDHET